MAAHITDQEHRDNGPSYESLETPYVRMMLEADKVPWEYNIIASAAHWILLAGYLVIPGTFTSLQTSDDVKSSLTGNEAGAFILGTIKNPPLLAMATLFFFTGIAIMGWLYWEYQSNYMWLINRIFMPTLLNAFAGLVTTLISLYTSHQGDWSIMVLLTVIASTSSMTASLVLLIIYRFVKLRMLKEEHNRIIQYTNHPSYIQE
ncbi:hypothetical protein N7454_003238 [Penicillium verhagenii]|nr:hypothetical protein N7454_003238 [Penicillium verhagenii]